MRRLFKKLVPAAVCGASGIGVTVGLKFKPTWIADDANAVSEGVTADVVASVAVGPAMAQVTAEQLKANRGFYAEGDLEIEWIRFRN